MSIRIIYHFIQAPAHFISQISGAGYQSGHAEALWNPRQLSVEGIALQYIIQKILPVQHAAGFQIGIEILKHTLFGHLLQIYVGQIYQIRTVAGGYISVQPLLGIGKGIFRPLGIPVYIFPNGNMILVAGLVEFHSGGHQLLAGVHDSDHNLFLLNHLAAGCFGQNGQAVLIIRGPVAGQHRDLSLRGDADISYIAAHDVAVQPFKQLLAGLGRHIIFINRGITVGQNILFNTSGKGSVSVTGKVLEGLSHAFLIKVHLCQLIAHISMSVGVDLSIFVRHHPVDPAAPA